VATDWYNSRMGDPNVDANASSVVLCDVSPRDGLQIEPDLIPTEVKVELIERACAAGVRRIEAVSFVSPKAVPQMADAERVLEALGGLAGISLAGLVVNTRGVERARHTRVEEVNAVVVATDTFCLRNQGMTTDDAIRSWHEIAAAARQAGIRPTVTIGASFGCPFEGDVPLGRLVDVVGRVAEANPTEIALADTIGVAVPSDVSQRVRAVRAAVGDSIPLRLHFHDTRNTAIANIVAGLAAGITTFDASIGGLGGCPFAPQATGNVAMEDVVYTLGRMGRATDIDLTGLIETARWLEAVLGRRLPGTQSHVPVFPPVAVS
jgi:hydroxymethylglutaryl-CoA lyase